MAKKKTINISQKPQAPRTEAASERGLGTDPFQGYWNEAYDFPNHGSEPSGENPSGPPHGLVQKLVYGAVYQSTYVVVFCAMTIGRIIPGRSIIGSAMVQGTAAARRDFHRSTPATHRADRQGGRDGSAMPA